MVDPLGMELDAGRRLESPNLKYLRVMAMAKPHRFRILEIDLETSTVVFASEGK